MSAPKDQEALTQYRLGMIEQTLQAVAENLQQLKAMDHKLIEVQAAIVGLQEAHKGMRDRHEKTDGRVHTIELELPTLKLIRSWVLAGVVGCAGLLGVTLFKVATMQATPPIQPVAAPAQPRER